MSNDAHIFVRDIETRSVADLKKVGLHNYATHPSTEILCIGYAIDDAPVKIWHPGEPIPKDYREAARHQAFAAVAHNAPFEMAIERYILAKQYNFPIIPVERNVCTMAVACALALPASLDKLAKALNFTHRKDAVGSRVMKQMSRPRRPRKGEDPNGIYWFDDAERMARNDAYCSEDVEVAREAAYRLPWLSDDEHQVWLLDQKINNRGIYIDHGLALAARKIVEAAEPYINREMTKITNGQVTGFTQVAQLKGWLAQHDVEVDSLDKASIDELLGQDLPEHVLRALELRYLGAQAAAKKVESLLSHRNGTGRVYDAFVYHAAGPGRWSSRGVQLHNMKRSATEDIEKAVGIIGQGDFEIARQNYDNPISTIGDLIRAMIVAEPGCMLLGADFSGIEARITAWLAGEIRKLDVFRAFDTGKGPDPYIIAAAAVFGVNANDLYNRYLAGHVLAREQRQVGKACELAFGFQGGVNAFLKFMPDGGSISTPVEALSFKRRGTTGQDPKRIKRVQQAGGQASGLSEEQIQSIKNAWRKAHPNIVAMWRDIDSAMWAATKRKGQRVLYRDKLVFVHDGQTLWITLPSGRKLSYPQTRIRRILDTEETGGLVIVSMKGRPALIFKDNASGQWRDVVVYGGLIVENCVQAIARDLLAQAMLRLDAAGLSIVAHVHDEAVIEVPDAKVEQTLPIFHRLMSASPEWAGGMPIVAKAWSASRFVK